MVASTALCILLLIYLIPSNGEEFKFKEKNVTYVQNNTKETIYLLDKNDYVARTSIATCNCDVRDKARELTEGLIIGGKKSDIIPSGFRSIIPPAVSILAVELVEGTLTIDFSRDLLDVNPKYEEKMIEAIVYTLTSLDGIDNVRILVEGEALNKLPKMDKALDVVLDNIRMIYLEGKHLEITNLIINDYNDSIEEIVELCDFIVEELGPEVPIHFSRAFPYYKMDCISPTNPETLFKAREIALDKGIENVYLGNI